MIEKKLKKKASKKGLDSEVDSPEIQKDNNSENLVKEDKELQTKIEALTSENEDLKKKSLFLLAEMENLRKRVSQERLEILKYKSIDFLQELLPNIELFAQCLNAKNVSDEIKNWLKGFEMIYSNIESVLQKENVIKIFPKVGDDFNHNFHSAVEEVASNDVAPGKIVLVKKPGYKLHDRLIMPAIVVVAKK